MELNREKFSGWFGALSKKKKAFVVFLSVILLVVLVGLGKNLAAEGTRRTKDNKLKTAIEAVMSEETWIKNDTYGGKTAQETKDLFVAALRKGDVESAVKYFVLSPKDKNKEMIANFTETARTVGAGKIADVVSAMVLDKDYGVEGITVNFVKYNEKGERDYGMELVKTKFGIWKIENL